MSVTALPDQLVRRRAREFAARGAAAADRRRARPRRRRRVRSRRSTPRPGGRSRASRTPAPRTSTEAVSAARGAFADGALGERGRGGPGADDQPPGRPRPGATRDELAELESLDNGKPVKLAQDRRRGADGRAAPPLRRVGRAHVRRDDPGPRAGHALLHAQGAGRRVRPDHPLELPDADGVMEARTGARRRLHGRAQARRADAADRAADRRARARGRDPRRAWSTSSPATATTGAALVDHAGVDKIAFTGSTEVGREIGAKAGRALKRVTLELGGKSPNIILPDADLGAAIAGSFQAIYFNSGQACNAGSRLFVHRDQFDEVVSALAERAGKSRARAGPRSEHASSAR